MKLEEIYSEYETENDSFECKVKLDRANVIGWLKTIDGFANNKGGTLLLGVEDKSNDLIGFDLKGADTEKLYFYKEIKEHFDIVPSINIESMPYLVKDKKRFLLKICVLESVAKPLVLKYHGMPMIFVRRDGYTSAATTEEIIAMSAKGNSPKFDQGKTNIKYSFDDFKLLREFYFQNAGKELKEKELLSLGFVSEDGYLKNGSLLFKDDYDGEKTKIVCSNYKGNTRGDDYIVTSNEFSGNLISDLKYIFEFIDQRMNHGFLKKDSKRIDIDAYPKRSIFEAVINSLAHRDYLLDGSAIYIDLFKNRLSISSPGSLFQTGELKKTYKLESFISKRRNKLISDVFVLCKAMEAKGTGFEKIIDDYAEFDSKYKPFVFSKNNQFTIVLPDLTNPEGVGLDDESIKIIGKPSNQSKYDSQILSYCYYESKSIREIVDYLGISNSSFFRKNILNSLVEDKYLFEKEGTRGKVYITNRDLAEII